MAKTISVRIDEELYEELKKIAQAESRTLGAQARYMLIKSVEAYITKNLEDK